MFQLRATFGDALLHTHRALLRDLQVLQAAADQQPAELSGHLEVVRAHLAKHFAIEEDGGYLSSVVQLHPYLSRMVQRLAQEHQDLLDALDKLRDEARAMSEPLGEKVKTWVRNVRRHERHEDALVQDAFIVDLSAED